MAGLVILASIGLAAAFLLLWCLRPEFRRQIERPKHVFQERLRRYDGRCLDASERSGAPIDESR